MGIKAINLESTPRYLRQELLLLVLLFGQRFTSPGRCLRCPVIWSVGLQPRPPGCGRRGLPPRRRHVCPQPRLLSLPIRAALRGDTAAGDVEFKNQSRRHVASKMLQKRRQRGVASLETDTQPLRGCSKGDCSYRQKADLVGRGLHRHFIAGGLQSSSGEQLPFEICQGSPSALLLAFMFFRWRQDFKMLDYKGEKKVQENAVFPPVSFPLNCSSA